jgi:hypothetical protein
VKRPHPPSPSPSGEGVSNPQSNRVCREAETSAEVCTLVSASRQTFNVTPLNTPSPLGEGDGG